MKKRLLSALLALALVFVLLPTTALAETPTQNADIYIAGTGWNFEKDGSTYQTVYYQIQSSKGVFLKEFGKEFGKVWTTNPYLEITRVGNDVTITVHGDMKISSNDSCIESAKSHSDAINLIITGTRNDTLTLTNSSIGDAIYSHNGDVTIKGGITVKAYSTCTTPGMNNARGIYVHNHNLTISGANTVVEAESKAAYSTVKVDGGNITISDGATLTAKNTSGDKAISFGSITADGYDFKYWTTNGYTTLTGEDKATNIQTYSRIKFTPTVIQKDNYVYIAGGPAVVGVRTSLGEGNGYYTYNKDTKTFTLENVNITSVINAIQLMADGTYTINLVGTNTISDVSAGIVASNLYGANDITAVLSGTGSLDITAGHYAIDMQTVGNLKFENTGTIKLTTGYKYPASTCNALYVVGNVTIDKTKYDITGQKQAQGFPTEDIGNSPVFKTILKGTDPTLYFKTITITPAAPKKSTISYGGKTLTQGQIINGENGGTATVAPNGNTITLNNFKGDKALVFNAEITPNSITLIGDSTLSAVETKYQSLTISGSGSLTVGSIRVTNNDNISADLTITDGAAVIAGTATSDAKAIDITGNLTVNSGATLTATNTSETKPTIDVTGNVTISGNPGTNAYTVSAHNSYNVQKDRVGNLSPSGVPSAIKIGGTLNISAGARVMAQTDSYGAGVMLGQNSTITVEDAFLSAKNSSCDFAAISFSGQTGKIYVSGEKGKVVAENIHTGTNLKFRAINAFVYNSNTNFYLKMQSEGVIAEAANKIIAPGKHDASGGKKVTITRGDEVTRTNSPVVIAGTTLLNDTYYTITNGSKVAEGTENNYNAFYNSKTKTLKLNNAQISHSFAHENGGGRDGAIIFTKFENYFIELSGENTISSTNTYAINCHRPDRTLTIKNAAGAENAKLTLTSNWMVVCSIGGLNIQSDVTMVNTKEAGYLMYVNDTFSFDGYNAYASVNASGSPLVEYTVPTSGDKDAGYQYLRITKETLETGGGSTHKHVFSTSWESNADYHWHKCTVQGCTEVSDKEAHVYTNTWWKNSNGNHGRTCDKCRHEGEIHEFRKYYDFVDATYHVERCSYPNCTYVGSNETHSYDSFGVCKCGYSPNGLPAPPSLQGVAPTSENGTDGKILNSNIGMEYAQNLNGPWTKWNEHSNITGLSAGTYYVRYTKTDERFPDNQVATVEVPAYTPGGDPTPDIPAAPTGLVGVAPTSENGNGKITGTTAQMEYASSLEGDWTTCANDSTDVPAGKYYVRMKKTDNTPAGEAVEVTVPAYSGTGEITPDPTPDNPGTIVIIRPAEEEKPAQQPNPSTGANDLVGLAVAAAVAAALGSAALLRKHD